MTFRLRAAQIADLEQLYEMAKLTGGGFTNLPADRTALTRKLERAEEAFARTYDDLGDDQFTLVLENTETGQVRGTCQMFSQVGQQWPFYSYRMTTLTQHSQELDRTVRAELLSLVTDLEGCSEVGGLFL
ncbi:MAG TPA: arginine N-succinyltransferase, partial [Erythrobacter sp.]|nr:arginine N-succinyltransferase [Erythrobacter sp.]